MAKQKQTKAAKHEMPKPTTRGWAKSSDAAPSVPSNRVPDEKALEVGVPMPPPMTSGSVLNSSERAEDETALGHVPGEMFPRIIAFFIDGAIVWALSWPLQAVLIGSYALLSSGMIDFTAPALRFISLYAVIFGYYGWFYSKKGASPGKLLMGLQVIDSTDGSKINYWKAFFREAVGKWISGIPLAIGYFTAFFRDDRRALHDLLFDTAVVRGPSAKNVGKAP
ncbi:MAG: RDD family protein [Bdellovibrionota bacterium]